MLCYRILYNTLMSFFCFELVVTMVAVKPLLRDSGSVILGLPALRLQTCEAFSPFNTATSDRLCNKRHLRWFSPLLLAGMVQIYE